MLQDLHIQGFKGFRDLHLTDLSRVTLVGGKNNIGKTSLLESIWLFYDISDPEWFLRHLQWRDIYFAPFMGIEELLSPIFTKFDIGSSIFFKVKDDENEARMTIQCDLSNIQKSVS